MWRAGVAMLPGRRGPPLTAALTGPSGRESGGGRSGRSVRPSVRPGDGAFPPRNPYFDGSFPGDFLITKNVILFFFSDVCLWCCALTSAVLACVSPKKWSSWSWPRPAVAEIPRARRALRDRLAVGRGGEAEGRVLCGCGLPSPGSRCLLCSTRR